MEFSNLRIRNSFTLIELLVVVGILIILTALTVPNFRFFQKKTDLSNSAEEIINSLRLAQNKTLASEKDSQWGIYFSTSTLPHQYTLFQGESFILRATSSDETHNLPKIIGISGVNLNGGSEVVFNRLTGTTNQSGSVSLELKTDPTKTKTIYIENSGQVGLMSPQVISDENRLKDSRHLHFVYNTNAQEAIILKLIFPDYPADNYDISFQDYLNVDKTEFDWEGTVLVGPGGSKTEQKLRVHTHSLTSFSAQFCVHRPLSPDQSYNDKALNISLDDEELIKYTTTGEVSEGSSFYVENLQRQ